MRPIHALVLVVVLALGLVGAALLINSGQDAAQVADPAQLTPKGTATAEARPAAQLDGSTDSDSAANARDVALAPARPEAPAATAPVVGLRGRLVDARGQPVAGATVLADGGSDFMPLEVEANDPPWGERAESKSNAEGRFVLQPKAKHRARLAVRAAGFAPHDQEVALAGADHDLGDVVLEDSAVLQGRVVDAGGRAVAGAELFRLREQEGGLLVFGTRGSGPKVATTDAQGRFQVDQLRAGPWKLRIAHEDHPDKLESGETPRPGAVVANLQFVLEEGDEIRGQVVDAPAELLSKLTVRATPRGGVEEHDGVEIATPGTLFGATRSSPVAPDGSFRLRGLKRGTSYRLVARDSEREWFGRTRSAAVEARSGERGVRLPYKPETAIVCQVVDALSGEPLEQLSVMGGFGFSMPLEDENGRAQQKFPGGRVRFTNLIGRANPDQGARFSIRATGYRSYEREDLVVAPGTDLDLGVVRLERAPLVRVRVVDAQTGAPVVGARVSMSEYRPPSNGNRMEFTAGAAIALDDETHQDLGFDGTSGKTDEQGRAQLTSKPGQTVVLRVAHAGHAAWESAPLALPIDGDHEETVRLLLGGTVLVRVLDGQQKPVAGSQVEHRGPGAQDGILMLGGHDDRTDARGELVFEHLQAGVHRFRVGGGGPAGAMIGNDVVVRIAGMSSDASAGGRGFVEATVAEGSNETIELIAPEQARLVGRVREAGQSLAGARVELAPKRAGGEDEFSPFLMGFGGGPSDRTDSQGEYAVEKLEAGSYQVTVSHPGRVMDWQGEVEIRAGENRFDVELPVAILEGKVTGPDGQGLAGVRVRAERAPREDDQAGGARVMRGRFVSVMATGDGDEEMSFSSGPEAGPTVKTDEQGKYRLRGVLPDIDLLVKAEGKDLQPAQSQPVRAAPDQVRSNVDIAMQGGGRVEVTLVRPDGKKAGPCIVTATCEGEGAPEPKTEFSGRDASVQFSGLKPGRWRVRADPAMGPGREGQPAAPIEQVVEVAIGKPAQVRLEIP